MHIFPFLLAWGRDTLAFHKFPCKSYFNFLDSLTHKIPAKHIGPNWNKLSSFNIRKDSVIDCINSLSMADAVMTLRTFFGSFFESVLMNTPLSILQEKLFATISALSLMFDHLLNSMIANNTPAQNMAIPQPIVKPSILSISIIPLPNPEISSWNPMLYSVIFFIVASFWLCDFLL